MIIPKWRASPKQSQIIPFFKSDFLPPQRFSPSKFTHKPVHSQGSYQWERHSKGFSAWCIHRLSSFARLILNCRWGKSSCLEYDSHYKGLGIMDFDWRQNNESLLKLVIGYGVFNGVSATQLNEALWCRVQKYKNKTEKKECKSYTKTFAWQSLSLNRQKWSITKLKGTNIWHLIWGQLQ